MPMNSIDLFLGSDLAFWVLQQVDIGSIGQVFTLDNAIAKASRQLGVKVWSENDEPAGFTPSKIGFSVHYPKILKPETISRYWRIYNLHPGYLPWGRGYYPIFWALWEQTPAGATLHEITEGLDKGPIVEQTQVEVFPYDTGESLFKRVREVEKKLFLEYWPKMVADENIPSFFQPGRGTHHSKKDFFELKKYVDWESMNGKDLLRLIRCLTFSDYTGLEIKVGNKEFEIHLERLKK